MYTKFDVSSSHVRSQLKIFLRAKVQCEVVHYTYLPYHTYLLNIWEFLLMHTYHTYLWDSTSIAPWLVTDRLRSLIYAYLNARNQHVRCQFKRIDRAQGEYKVVQI